MPDLSISERSDGTGTISFGAPQQVAANGFVMMPGIPGLSQQSSPRFDLVAQARSVFELIRKAQVDLA